MSEKKDENFWERYLAGCQPTSLPSTGRNAQITSPGAPIYESLPKVHGEISDSVLVAAWSFVISAHGLAEDIIFGLAVANRHYKTIPFRIQVPEDGETTCADLVGKAQASLDEVVAAQTDTSPHNHDLTAIAGLLKSCSTCLTIDSHDSSLTRSNSQASPLLVTCSRMDDEVKITGEAESRFCEPAILRSLLGHFRHAIQAFATNPAKEINTIDLLEDSDLNELDKWFQCPEPAASQPFLHKEIEEQARKRPLSVAIGQTDMVMTYAELNEGADALARYLLDENSAGHGGIGNVAIFFTKSAFAVLAMLAVLKAGGAYVPIDTEWPSNRIEKVIRNAQISSMLCSEDQETHLEPFSFLKVIPVTHKLIYGLKKKKQSDQPISSTNLQPESPAYIIHTSGSTGDPKGIEISHRSITTSLNAMNRYFDISSSTRTLQFNAFTFDVSVGDIWTTLSRGGRICMPSEAERFNLDDFIEAERVNFAFITPSVAATINPDIVKRNFRKLATIGEAVKPEFLKRYAPSEQPSEDVVGYVLCDTYGPAEASVVATGSAPIKISADGNRMLSQRAGNIGEPMNCGVFIVSARNPHYLAPLYAPGEIAIVGHTLATGYWGDGEKTNAAFRTDLKWSKDERLRRKFGDSVMKTVYLTGDIGRYSEKGDGDIIFMHRRGGYMKVNGLRIDPGEIEAAIIEAGTQASEGTTDSVPCWRRAAVCCLESGPDQGQQQTLICFLAENEAGAGPGSKSKTLETSEARRRLLKHVSEKLGDIVPAYMVPTLFVMVDHMPLSTSAKLDRTGLLSLLDGREWGEIVREFALKDGS